MFESVVKNGATLLDASVPGWYKKIDLDRLDIQHASKCIIGQVFGDYWDGRDLLSINDDNEISHGFFLQHNIGRKNDYKKRRRFWKKLNKAWERAIQRRLAEENRQRQFDFSKRREYSNA